MRCSAGISGGAGIGLGSNSTSGNMYVTIDNVRVMAEGGSGAACIGAGANSSFSTNPTQNITITNGEVYAFSPDGGVGIGDDNIDVVINGSGGYSYPWIYTNLINDNGTEPDDAHIRENYVGIICIGDSVDDAKNGTACGSALDNVKDQFAAGDIKQLTVLGGEKYTINKDDILTLDGTILYLKAGATLDHWKRVNRINGGAILHEDPSEYDEKTGECKICGELGTHEYNDDEWDYNETHHWNTCKKTFDCSVDKNEVTNCNLVDHSVNQGYAEHEYDYDDPIEEYDDRWIYKCVTCEHTAAKLKPV
ncbi:MAG: hypothetical protein NC120_09965 [Ruminococcus sp.]|nr:hypothetical protein [Ruminococcus sp.]